MAMIEAGSCTLGDCAGGGGQATVPADLSVPFNQELKGLITNYTAVVGGGGSGESAQRCPIHALWCRRSQAAIASSVCVNEPCKPV
jgi:hypothetical protein